MPTPSKGPQKHIPLRRCIATGEQRPKSEMIRIVRTPEGAYLVDGPKGRTSGRGAYLAPDVKSLELALKKRALERVFQTKLSDTQLDQIKEGFVRRLLEMETQ
jgi:predicted RNA-binding protein YlxR (DUF448 family)